MNYLYKGGLSPPYHGSEIDIRDAVYLTNYLFRDGPASNPLEAGDVTCDEVVNISDVVYLINYLFKYGPEP
jgi:hypothetical protein